MSLKKMKKEELEQLTNKEITKLIIQDAKKPQTIADLFKKIISLLELPESTFENKIAEYYTQISTDKDFILLDNGKLDLRVNHKSSSNIDEDEEEDEDLEEEDNVSQSDMEMSEEDNYDDTDDAYSDDSTDEDLKDLVIIDEDELELDN
ncbi:MAG: DNA-directed RNA polymerase subunit delta [Bacilli bacterium]|jgi:DNA-directed RNA polymerase subunit delta|nr:DNA-directed RNA polymerase subunit delta [Bacilli bacterium]